MEKHINVILKEEMKHYYDSLIKPLFNITVEYIFPVKNIKVCIYFKEWYFLEYYSKDGIKPKKQPKKGKKKKNLLTR